MITFLKHLIQKFFYPNSVEKNGMPDPDALGLIPITTVPERESNGNR